MVSNQIIRNIIGAIFGVIALCGYSSTSVASSPLDNPLFAECLGAIECGALCVRDNGHQNGNKYTGFFQFGAELAASVLCTNASSLQGPWMVNCRPNPNKPGSNMCDTNWAKLQGPPKCQIAQKYLDMGIGDDWLAGNWTNGTSTHSSYEIQYQMFLDANQNELERILRTPELMEKIGQDVNGVEITLESMLAMAWLKGWSGMYNTVVNGGAGTDANGTSTLGYANCLNNCMANGGQKGDCSLKMLDVCRGKAGQILDAAGEIIGGVLGGGDNEDGDGTGDGAGGGTADGP